MTEPAMPPTPTEPTIAPRADGLPQRASVAPADGRPPLDLARRIVELAEDKKAADIVLLDLAGLTTMADYFMICSGGSERQLSAIADGIIGSLRDEKTRPIGREGTAASHWVLVDFGSVIVHIFTPPERDYYGLEKHWSEARPSLASSSAAPDGAGARCDLRSRSRTLGCARFRCSVAPSPAPSGATILGSTPSS